MTNKVRYRVGFDRKAEFGFWTGLLIVAGGGGAAAAAGFLLRLNRNWEDALFLTVVLFVTLTLVLRPAWRRKQLWRDLAVALAVHVCALTLVVQALTANGRTMGGPLRTLVVLVWALFLLAVLWRRKVSMPAR